MISDSSRRWREKYPHRITRTQATLPSIPDPGGILSPFSHNSNSIQTNTARVFCQYVITRFAPVGRPTRQMLADFLPDDRRGLGAQLQQQVVLLPRPGSPPIGRVEHVHPAVAALRRVPRNHLPRHTNPVFHPKEQENQQETTVLVVAPTPLLPLLQERLVVARPALDPRPSRNQQRHLLPALRPVPTHALQHPLVLSLIHI